MNHQLMLGLNSILSRLMEECDVDDARLSRETGIPASTLARLRLHPGANPTASTLRPIAKFFSISISQLLGDEAIPTDRLPGTHNPSTFTSSIMPIVEWDCIQEWIKNGTENIKGKLKRWISTEKNVGEKSFALNILTDSFGLAFRKGSLIIVDPAQKPHDGDLVLIYLVKENLILLRQLLSDGSELYVRSVNPEMKGTKLLDNTYQLIGVVIETRFNLDENTKKISLKRLPMPLIAPSPLIQSTTID